MAKLSDNWMLGFNERKPARLMIFSAEVQRLSAAWISEDVLEAFAFDWVVYQALESARHFGCRAPDEDKAHKNDYGCFIGAAANDYYDNVATHPANGYSLVGNSRAFYSGRISHQFGLTGPAMTIDTACSSSLVALHAACQAIRMGECSRAIAGSTNIFTSPYQFQALSAAGFLSKTGQSKSFDSTADGYCRGEGVAAITLKPLATAVAEGDHVLAVILGTATNQITNEAHIAVPCAASQAKLYSNVLRKARVSPYDVTYVKCHGTGTQVGDLEKKTFLWVPRGRFRDDLRKNWWSKVSTSSRKFPQNWVFGLDRGWPWRSRRSAGGVRTMDFPESSNCQYDPTSSAPGKRQAIPTIAIASGP